MTRILDGRAIARAIEAEQAERVRLAQSRGLRPRLAAFVFGDDAPSHVYGAMIARACGRVGIEVSLVELGASTSPADAIAALERANADPSIHAIIVKRPLPGALADESILQKIAPRKDADGCHFENVGRLAAAEPGDGPVPCTPAGVLERLSRSGGVLDGMHVVVIGRSATVGRPLAILLASKRAGTNSTVTICHRGTRDLASHVRRADVVVAAIGVAGFVGREMIAPGAIVVDVGTNAVPDASAKSGYRLVGDTAFDDLVGRCAAITPVPGGVGPVTVAMLAKNVVDCALRAERGSVAN